MKSNKFLILLSLVLVLLIVGASILYQKLLPVDGGDRLAGLPSEERPSETTASTHVHESSEDAPATQAPAENPEVHLEFDFTVYDANGNAVRLSDFVGKPIILNFWASWCGPCQAEMPSFDRMYQELGDEVHFLMVNLTDGSSETVATASAFIQEKGYTFPVYFDKDTDAAAVFGVYSIPVTYFMDETGAPIAYASGAIDEDVIRKGLAMVEEAN